MRTILRIQFGSHLYGTSTPASDFDFKSVFIPDARDILLGRAKGSISEKRPKAEGEKNYAGEVEEEAFSLQKYLQLLAQGQTVALDVLFAPDDAVVEGTAPHVEWREIVRNRHRLITKKSAAFVGYCRQQANKYGIKGSRVAAAREALAVLAMWDACHPNMKLATAHDHIVNACTKHEHMIIEDIKHPNGTCQTFWNVCGRKLPYTNTIRSAHSIVERLVNEYGHRALQAESNQGVDWKALSHAVRVANQAIELLETGHVTFPLPNAQHILNIKLGRLPYQEVAAEIEAKLELVEAAAAKSTLREEPDQQWIDDFVAKVYGDAVCAAIHG
ncbi:MAG: nucleotidyltransferase domain-containing protein [Rhizobiaceae bacterium]|nr:nucleotidyltransferase domain-containing protein [Rhizobiaceae bacterium]MCC0000896.1 nucleotidyltransferase domain-containing protein [Methylobacteriaceae bacterium]